VDATWPILTTVCAAADEAIKVIAPAMAILMRAGLRFI